jgi:hypothetical protein
VFDVRQTGNTLELSYTDHSCTTEDAYCLASLGSDYGFAEDAFSHARWTYGYRFTRARSDRPARPALASAPSAPLTWTHLRPVRPSAVLAPRPAALAARRPRA